MLQLLAARAGVAIAAAVGTLVDTDVVGAGYAAKHITCRRTNDSADTGTNRRAQHCAARCGGDHEED